MKQLLITCITLLVVAALLSGCGLSEDLGVLDLDYRMVDVSYVDGDDSIAVFGSAYDKETEQLPIIRIDSKGELDAFTASAGEHFFGLGLKPNDDPAFYEQTAAYGEDYFEEKILLICYVYSLSSPAEFEVAGTSIADETLTVKIEATAGIDQGMECKLIFLEATHRQMKGVSRIQAFRVTDQQANEDV